MSKDIKIADLQEIMIDIFDDEELSITPETTAEDVDDWDSLTHISLIIAIEKKWDIKFTHSEISDLKNVGEFIDLLSKKIN
jgi:acyl carrier protein